MPSIPIDVLQMILEHVDKNDLAILCRVSKIFCSCSRDVLYREIDGEEAQHVIQTLAQSTDLAKRVRSFYTYGRHPELATALRNMSSLRNLGLEKSGDASFIVGCTFKLDSFSTDSPNSESLQKFLNSQPSLTSLTMWNYYRPISPFDERCLPNLTRVKARPSWLGILIPGRPVREVIPLSTWNIDSIDLSFLTLSTTPIQKLVADFDMLYPKPVSLLVSIFPSLVHLVVYVYNAQWAVRVRLCLSI